uniref:Uncharacterized protein n=1 Tax=Opuntia streptacantha TaxID=393608 RepID=A0A7C9EEG7_OPUST
MGAPHWDPGGVGIGKETFPAARTGVKGVVNGKLDGDREYAPRYETALLPSLVRSKLLLYKRSHQSLFGSSQIKWYNEEQKIVPETGNNNNNSQCDPAFAGSGKIRK